MFIQSNQNPHFKALLKLHEVKERKRTGQFLVEGQHLIEEALKVGALDQLILCEGTISTFDFKQELTLSLQLFSKLSQTQSMGKMIGLCHLESPQILNTNRILICDRIQDPGNMGSMIRSACAFGFDQIICSQDCVDVTNEKVIRSTQGALFHIPIQYADLTSTIQSLKQQDVKVYGTGFEHSQELSNIQTQAKMAFVLGNEGTGVSTDILKACDDIITIEMAQFESLNVASATAILLYQFRKS